LKKQAEELAVGYKFENWKHVDQILYAYGKEKSFDGNISKKVYEHIGKPKLCKGNNPDTTRANKSSCVECTYYINICWPKKDSNSES